MQVLLRSGDLPSLPPIRVHRLWRLQPLLLGHHIVLVLDAAGPQQFSGKMYGSGSDGDR